MVGRGPGRGRSGRRGAVGLLVAVALLSGVGAYGVADIRGHVPGPLTDDPVPDQYPALGTAPGAREPQPLTSTPARALDEAAPAPDPAALVQELAPLLADPRLGPSVAASVVDARTGATLYDRRATAAQEPASVAKLLTAAATLDRLGPEATVTTSVVGAAGSPELYLLGGGDVLMAAGAGDTSRASGRAGLGDLAEQTAQALAATGRTSVTLRLDDSVLGGLGWGEAIGPGWEPADVSNGYVAPVTGIAVNAGRTRDENYAPRLADPGLSAAQVFADALGTHGITVQGPLVRGRAPQGAATLASVTSAPLAEVVAHVLVTSDNNGAEALARLVAVDRGAAPGFASAGAAVLAQVAELGLATGGLVLADGSGLSDGSRLSPAVLTGVLAAAASEQHVALRPLVVGLPVAGLDGTLADRFASASGAGAGQGVVRAKTGSLTGVGTLAGTVLDADGRLLAFAVMADQVPSSIPARQALDRVASTLAGCGCR